MLVLIGLAMLGSDNSTHAQVRIESGGRWDLINAGLGMSTRGLPVFIGLEQTVDDHISAGLIGTFQSYRESGAAGTCLLYTSPSPRDRQKSRMPSSA